MVFELSRDCCCAKTRYLRVRIAGRLVGKEAARQGCFWRDKRECKLIPAGAQCEPAGLRGNKLQELQLVRQWNDRNSIFVDEVMN
jgi:hypothetical protein